MPGYVTILLFTIFVIGIDVTIFKFRRKAPTAIKVIGTLLLCFWIATIFIPSLLFLIPPFTPAIKGRIIDAETGKPLTNINIKAGWKSGSVDSPSTYKAYYTKTDESGNFYLPRTWKVPAFFAPPFIYWYRAIDIMAYSHDYKFAWKRIDRNKEFKPVELAMKTFANDKDYLEDVRDLPLHFSDMKPVDLFQKKEDLTPDEKEFVIKAHRLFEKKFPESNLGEDNLLDLSGLFSFLRDYTEDLKVLREIVQKYPGSDTAKYAEHEIKRLIKDHNLKKGAYEKEGGR